MEKVVLQINKVGKRVFLSPTPTYSYEELIFNKKVLAGNTYRGFHRIDKQKPGAQDVFETILRNEKNYILKTLINASSEKDIDTLEIHLCSLIKEGLKSNIRLDQLNSFNKIRKPIDIVIEHIVAMCSEIDKSRENVIKLLYLPLDSQIFQSEITFTEKETKELNIQRNFTFKDIIEGPHYYKIQEFLKNKARVMGIHYRISFDLIWGDRYKKEISNLFADSYM